MPRLGGTLTLRQVRDIIWEVDDDLNGKLSWDEFEAAYLFVVGERFEAPKKSLNAARWLERVASPATCEIFERTDPRSGRKRKAVTLARHEDLEKRLKAMTWTCKECKAQHPHFHASFCGGCGAARKKKATPRR